MLVNANPFPFPYRLTLTRKTRNRNTRALKQTNHSTRFLKNFSASSRQFYFRSLPTTMRFAAIALCVLVLVATVSADCGEPGLSARDQVVTGLLPGKQYPTNHTVEYECPGVGFIRRRCLGAHWSGEVIKCPSKLETKVSARIPQQRGLNFIWNGNRKVRSTPS